MLTLILAAGKLGDVVYPGASTLSLVAVLNSLIMGGMLPNAAKFKDMPGVGRFATSSFPYDPTPHHVRTLSLLVWNGILAYGVKGLVDATGYTTIPGGRPRTAGSRKPSRRK